MMTRESIQLQDLILLKRQFVEEWERALTHARHILTAFAATLTREDLDLGVRQDNDSVSFDIGPRRFRLLLHKQLAAVSGAKNDEARRLYAALTLTASDGESDDAAIELKRVFVNQYNHVLEWTTPPLRGEGEPQTFMHVKRLEGSVHLSLLTGAIRSLARPLSTWALLSEEDKELFRRWQAIPTAFAQEFLSAQ